MIVDTETVKASLLDLLPRALQGEPVQQLAGRLPWPRGSQSREGSGLWWDVD